MARQFSIQIHEMAQLKIECPGIDAIRHQHIQHGNGLQGCEVAGAIGHGAVGHLKQVFEQGPIFGAEVGRDLAELGDRVHRTLQAPA